MWYPVLTGNFICVCLRWETGDEDDIASDIAHILRGTHVEEVEYYALVLFRYHREHGKLFALKYSDSTIH